MKKLFILSLAIFLSHIPAKADVLDGNNIIDEPDFSSIAEDADENSALSALRNIVNAVSKPGDPRADCRNMPANECLHARRPKSEHYAPYAAAAALIGPGAWVSLGINNTEAAAQLAAKESKWIQGYLRKVAAEEFGKMFHPGWWNGNVNEAVKGSGRLWIKEVDGPIAHEFAEKVLHKVAIGDALETRYGKEAFKEFNRIIGRHGREIIAGVVREEKILGLMRTIHGHGTYTAFGDAVLDSLSSRLAARATTAEANPFLGVLLRNFVKAGALRKGYLRAYKGHALAVLKKLGKLAGKAGFVALTVIFEVAAPSTAHAETMTDAYSKDIMMLVNDYRDNPGDAMRHLQACDTNRYVQMCQNLVILDHIMNQTEVQEAVESDFDNEDN
ncbi:hypothetical protein ACFL6Y_10160 [Elusimicrobiota bacterium]